MAWQYHPVIVLFFMGGLIALGVGVFSWQYVRRYGRSHLVVAVGLLGVADTIWSVSAALKTASVELGPKLLFYKLQFLGSWVAPSLTLVIALSFVGWDRWLTRRTVALLAVVPVVGIVLILLNPGQAMIVAPTTIQAQGISALEHEFPPLFVLFFAWALGLATLSAVIVAYGGLNGIVPRKPAALATVVFLLPSIVVALKMGGIYPPGGDGVNLTPGANAVALGILAIAIVNYRIFELLPVGRHRAIEIMDDGYVLVGADGTVADANAAAADLLGTERPRTLVGTPIEDIVPVYHDIAATDGSDRARFETDGAAIEVRSSPVERQHQRAGHLLLLQDVTEQRRRKRELEETNERLEEFASVVSHDLRNPLTVARGHLEAERERFESEHLSTVATSLDRMEALIDDVLTIARQGRPISDPEPVSLSSVATRCWSVVSTSGATLTVEDDLTFVAETGRLQQLLENLFRNSVEHGSTTTPSDVQEDSAPEPDDTSAANGRGTPGVTIRVGALEDGAGFYVADDGPGIPAEDREEVFGRGYTTAQDGTGFGLAIVEEIATAHGWTVSVTESRDGGARFEIRGVETVGDRRPTDTEAPE